MWHIQEAIGAVKSTFSTIGGNSLNTVISYWFLYLECFEKLYKINIEKIWAYFVFERESNINQNFAKPLYKWRKNWPFKYKLGNKFELQYVVFTVTSI